MARGLATIAVVGLVGASLLAPVGGSAQSPSPSTDEASFAPASSAPPSPTLVETFDEPNDAWWTGEDAGERTSFTDGGLRTILLKGPYSTWQWVDLIPVTDRIRVEAWVVVEEGSGGGGPICGPAEADDRFFWGGINGDGEWLLGRIVDGHLQVATRGSRPLVRHPEAPVGAPFPIPITLECAVDPDGGGDRLVLWVDGVGVARIVDEQMGPYGKAGLATAGDRPGLSVLYDDYRVWDEDALSPAPTASPAASPAASP